MRGGVKGSVLMCQGQTGKIACLSPGKCAFSAFSAIIPLVFSKNLALSPTHKLLF